MLTVRRSVAFIIFPEFQLLDAAGPIAAFEVASRHAKGAYALRLMASTAGRVSSSSGVTLDAEALCSAGIDTVLVVGGYGCRGACKDEAIISFLRFAARSVPRLASVCSGALVLAEAGLLDGKRATTHWSRVEELKGRYPSVQVDLDRLWIRDGQVWTSAGISAGIDLALAIITHDLGPTIAREVARQLVVSAQRPGGHTQHSHLLDLGAPDGRFAELNAWMRQNLERRLDVSSLASRAKMAPRTFARAYAAETGDTPAKAVERLRFEAARALIGGGADLADIAQRTGFGDITRMRRAFVRLSGDPPSASRLTQKEANARNRPSRGAARSPSSRGRRAR